MNGHLEASWRIGHALCADLQGPKDRVYELPGLPGRRLLRRPLGTTECDGIWSWGYCNTERLAGLDY